MRLDRSSSSPTTNRCFGWLLAGPVPVVASLLAFAAAALDFGLAREAFGWLFFLAGGVQAGLAVVALTVAGRRICLAAAVSSLAALALCLSAPSSNALPLVGLEATAAAAYLILLVK